MAFSCDAKRSLTGLIQIGQSTIILFHSISQLKWLWFRDGNPAYAGTSMGPFSSLLLVWRRWGVPLVYLELICSWGMLLIGAFAQQASQQPLREVP